MQATPANTIIPAIFDFLRASGGLNTTRTA